MFPRQTSFDDSATASAESDTTGVCIELSTKRAWRSSCNSELCPDPLSFIPRPFFADDNSIIHASRHPHLSSTPEPTPKRPPAELAPRPTLLARSRELSPLLPSLPPPHFWPSLFERVPMQIPKRPPASYYLRPTLRALLRALATLSASSLAATASCLAFSFSANSLASCNLSFFAFSARSFRPNLKFSFSASSPSAPSLPPPLSSTFRSRLTRSVSAVLS